MFQGQVDRSLGHDLTHRHQLTSSPGGPQSGRQCGRLRRKKYIVSASGDRTIKVWNTSNCEFVRTLNGHKRGIACLQYRDRLVVSGSSDNTIRYLTNALTITTYCHVY